MQTVGIIYINPARTCIPIYGHKFGDLKTDWNELVNAFKIGISEQAILFVYAGPISDITIPGKTQNRNPIVKHPVNKMPANRYLFKFLFNSLYGTFQVMISFFSKYKAGITINKTDNSENTTL